jgi:hypothetical protein
MESAAHWWTHLCVTAMVLGVALIVWQVSSWVERSVSDQCCVLFGVVWCCCCVLFGVVVCCWFVLLLFYVIVMYIIVDWCYCCKMFLLFGVVSNCCYVYSSLRHTYYTCFEDLTYLFCLLVSANECGISMCSNNGNCTDQGKCECEPGWGGKECNISMDVLEQTTTIIMSHTVTTMN